MNWTPGPPLLWGGAAWVALAVAAAFWPALVPAWQVAGAALGAVALQDHLRLRRAPSPQVQRSVSRALPVGVWNPVTLEVRNGERQRVAMLLHDLHPPQCEVRGLPAPLALEPGQTAQVRYQMRAPHRGAEAFAGVELLLHSPLGLWRQRRRLGSADPLRIYPNFSEIAHYTLLATDHRLSQMGVRRRQRRGEGNDFHQLREYRTGDSLRQIDWKATSRYRNLISREYQEERDQQILFVVDCSRRMRHAEEGRVHLDEALNAVLLLAYVALRQGDAVGLMTFGGVKRWFAPRKGAQVVNALLQASYDLQATTEAADYLEAAGEVLAAQRRRALIVLITNTREEDQYDLSAAIRLLRKRHLVAVADLRESILDELVASPVGDLDGALRYHAAVGYLDARRQNHERLGHRGAQVLDVRPRQLPAALVNHYFALKRAGTL